MGRRISIHAPPRGATGGSRLLPRVRLDFNSRPSARGDAAVVDALPVLTVYFNSRPSARGDAIQQRAGRVGVCISIHAPPRGATFSKYFAFRRKRYFNSRPSARGDLLDLETSEYYPQFQFTPLREGRLQRIIVRLRQLLISIHAPPRGATASP